jgi:GNAT superfamily N-acetyltransferase
MHDMIDSAAADAAADGLHAALVTSVTSFPGGYTRTGDGGTRLLFTGLRAPTLNTLIFGPEPDLAEIEKFAEELSATGLPWSIELRRDADQALLDLAASYGRTSSFSLPLLAWDSGLLSSLPAHLPDGATFREVPGSESEKLVAALASGFEMPVEVARGFAGSPGKLDTPGITAFILEVDGETVATGLNIIAGDYVGLFSGCVPPLLRRKGYYRALVAARLRHAVAAGARHAVTLNTPMSRPLYESFGFHHVETWTYLVAES